MTATSSAILVAYLAGAVAVAGLFRSDRSSWPYAAGCGLAWPLIAAATVLLLVLLAVPDRKDGT